MDNVSSSFLMVERSIVMVVVEFGGNLIVFVCRILILIWWRRKLRLRLQTSLWGY